jgi:hypothetical protein
MTEASLRAMDVSFIGRACELGADGLTISRAVGGVALAHYIAETPTYQSWNTVGKFIALAATDAEGRLARFGRRLQNKDERLVRHLPANLDLAADKILINAVTSAIAANERKQGNKFYAACVGATTSLNMTRDILTSGDRFVAQMQHIDTRAQAAGKKKGILQYVTNAFALSPLAKGKHGKVAASLGFVYCTKHSLTSGLLLHKFFRTQRKAQARKPI